jgi:hypothetical protein
MFNNNFLSYRRQDVINTSGTLLGLGVTGVIVGEVVEYVVKSFLTQQLNSFSLFIWAIASAATAAATNT